MTDEIKTRIVDIVSEMTILTEKYSAATSDIINTDIDETLEDIVSRRAAIIDEIGRCRAEIDTLCSDCTDQENDLVHRMIRGDRVPLGLSAELREIHKAAVKLHSAYIAIDDKEKQAAARVDARVKELRTELETVNADRKKTSVYSAIGSGFGGSGGSFDGRL
ncbi:MAG: hypothetical protein IJU82_04945 [Ruminiclostridium sp.]|nr:hypothetical protein [Ruminiclostridium sp.]